jgi:glycosyltransferase involved in cell wall biosynthesis
MKPLTIALCLHGYFPEQFFGTAVYVRQLAQALRRLGHRPVVITPHLHDKPVAAPAAPEVLDGIEVRRILRPMMRGVRDSYDDPRLAGTLQAMLRDIGADVVHVAHFLGLGTAIFTAAEALNLPVFATLTDFHGFCHRGTLVNSWHWPCKGPNRARSNCLSCGLRDQAMREPESLALAYLASWLARTTTTLVLPRIGPLLPAPIRGDVQAVLDRPNHLREAMAGIRAAIAPTRFLHDAYRRNGFAMPITVAPFGIDADRSTRPTRAPGPLRVGFIGQIGWHKGCHVLLDAARNLKRGTVAIGIWGDMTRHRRYAENLRHRSHGLDIAFHGPLALEALDGALRSLDVLVMPSLWAENAPLTLLQALACHTPCIISDQPGMREFVQDGVNGHLFAAGDVQALAVILKRLAAAPAGLRRLTEAAGYACNSTEMAETTLSLYRRHGIDCASR